MALGAQQLMQPRRRQPLLAAGPLPRLRQQRLDPRPDRRPHRPPPRLRLLARRRRLVQILPDRHPRDPQLARHRPLRPPFHQHLVPDHMHLVHPEHPLQRTPAPRTPASPLVRPSGGLLSERRMDHFPSGAPTRRRLSLRQLKGGVGLQEAMVCLLSFCTETSAGEHQHERLPSCNSESVRGGPTVRGRQDCAGNDVGSHTNLHAGTRSRVRSMWRAPFFAASSGVNPCSRATKYAAYHSDQWCFGAVGSYSPWRFSVSWRSAVTSTRPG